MHGRCYVCRRTVCDAPLHDADSVAAALARSARWEADA